VEDAVAKKRKKLTATVKKIIKPVSPTEPEKAEIDVHDADPLYREIRVDSTVADEHGEKGKLKEGEKVDVIVEADSSDPAIKKMIVEHPFSIASTVQACELLRKKWIPRKLITKLGQELSSTSRVLLAYFGDGEKDARVGSKIVASLGY